MNLFAVPRRGLTLVPKPGVDTDDFELREGPGAMGSRSACHPADRSVRQGRRRPACIRGRWAMT